METFEKKYNDLIARINEAKEKPSLCMKDKHHYNGYVETGIRDALDYVVNPKGEGDEIRDALARCVLTDLEGLIQSADSRAYFSGLKEYIEDVRQFAYNKALVDAREKQKDERELSFIEGKVEGVKQTCQEIKDAMPLFEPKDLTPFELTFRDYIDSAIRYCLSGEGYQQYIKEWAADLLNLEKQKEQKPAEWSEEDEKMFNVISYKISQHQGKGERDLFTPDEAEFMYELECRLKSLRPQPHWKPSEEQIRALEYFIRSWGESGTMSPQNPALCAAKSLYNDLKKL